MISPARLNKLIARLGLLPFFPTNRDQLDALGELIVQFAVDDFQLDWLGERMLGLYREWPGPMELRACFCSKFKPADGIEVHSSVYPDGIPSERKTQAQTLALPPGREVSVDAGLEKSILALTEAKDMNAVGRIKVPNIEVNPNFKAVTQADVDRAVAELRDKRARDQLYGSPQP